LIFFEMHVLRLASVLQSGDRKMHRTFVSDEPSTIDESPALWSRTDVSLQSLCKDPPKSWAEACTAEADDSGSNSDTADETFKIIHYNTFKMHERGVHGLLFAWLVARKATYVSFNELNGFNASSFADTAAQYGFRHAAFHESKSGYHLGFASKEDPVVDSEEWTEGFSHGLLKVSTQAGWTFVITHLSPASPQVSWSVPPIYSFNLHMLFNHPTLF
jgi:hypothetical protein